MTAASKIPTRRVVIGGQEFDKPWDPACGACRSPWLGQIDVMLAEGYSFDSIRRYFEGTRPKPPNNEILRRHIAHLAEPHRKARLAFEEAAQGRGDDTARDGAQLPDALRNMVRLGTERLALGHAEVQPRDMLNAAKLLLQIQRSEAVEGLEASAWQAAFMEFFEIVRKHLSPPQWHAFVTEVYESPAIRAVLAGQPALPGGLQ